MNESNNSFGISSQDLLPATQEPLENNNVGEQSLNTWGRLLSVKENIPFYNLINDTYSFGRGSVTCKFTEEHFTQEFLNTLSKIHFRICRQTSIGFERLVVLEDFSSNGTLINDVLVGKNNKRVLCHNDQIALVNSVNKVFVFYDCINNDADDFPTALREKYTMARTIGRGSYGDVRLAYDNNCVLPVAVKIMSRNLESVGGTVVDNERQINKEIELLRKVDHPCVIKLIDLVESPDKFFIVMELARGGELFKRITRNGALSEFVAKLYFYQILLGVAYLHENHITHRDIKPENILLASDEEHALVKLSDFGLSKLKQSVMTSFVGTQNYIAPELIVVSSGNGKQQRQYSNKVDLWSLGVVLYACLSGELPFNGKDDYEKLRRIRLGRYGFPSPRWQGVSDTAKDMIKALLVVNPEHRLSAAQTLQHPWFEDQKMIEIIQRLMISNTVNNPGDSRFPLGSLKRPSQDTSSADSDSYHQ